ncbi:hypothetical protein BS47DRAFT_1358660 [Hydnum rufescens UP504]|uniref:Uncharacterized protein n=1 Tax=Hydnum rufescens UP504 TaxID=1448309 RepID=A0A9P6E1N0_9AGAM|nr:hypothetical protein BS47DRAFT_1358660 [Hydnum rufescens UP504]
MVDGIFTFYIAPISPFLETNIGVLGVVVCATGVEAFDYLGVLLPILQSSTLRLMVTTPIVMRPYKISLVFLGSNETQWQFVLTEANRRSQFEAYGPFPTTLPPTMHFLPRLQSQRWFSKLAYAHARTLKPQLRNEHQELYETRMEMGSLGSNIATSLDDRGILIASTPCPSIKPMPLQIQNAFVQGTLLNRAAQLDGLQMLQMEELVLLIVVHGHTDSPRKFHSFNQGMQLETRNGFHFLELAARFEGGLPGLLGVLQGGKIISLSTLLENVTISPGSAEAQVRLLSIPGHSYSNFSNVLTDFLSGTGIPNIALAQSQGLLMLGDQIGEDLDSQDPSLCSCLFHRAATGSEALLKSTSVRVHIQFSTYGENNQLSTVS